MAAIAHNWNQHLKATIPSRKGTKHRSELRESPFQIQTLGLLNKILLGTKHSISIHGGFCVIPNAVFKTYGRECSVSKSSSELDFSEEISPLSFLAISH